MENNKNISSTQLYRSQVTTHGYGTFNREGCPVDGLPQTRFSGHDKNYQSRNDTCRSPCSGDVCLGRVGLLSVGEKITSSIRQRFGRQPLFQSAQALDKQALEPVTCAPLDLEERCGARLPDEPPPVDPCLNVFDQATSHEYSSAPYRHSRLVFGDGSIMLTRSVPPGVRYHYPTAEASRDDCQRSGISAPNSAPDLAQLKAARFQGMRHQGKRHQGVKESIQRERSPFAGVQREPSLGFGARIEAAKVTFQTMQNTNSLQSLDALKDKAEGPVVKINEAANQYHISPRPAPEDASKLYLSRDEFKKMADEAFSVDGQDVYDLGQAPRQFKMAQ